MGVVEDILDGLGLKAVPYLRNQQDDDNVDRLSHRWTVMLLFTFAVVVLLKQFVGDPIHCWYPAHFLKDCHDEYTSKCRHILGRQDCGDTWRMKTNDYCWIQSTYYLPYDEDIPSEKDVTKPIRPISYYQWVPAILLVEALMFYVPYYFWTIFSIKSGIHLHTIIWAADSEIDDISSKLSDFMTQHVDRYLECHKHGDDTYTSDQQPPQSLIHIIKRCLTRTCCKPFGRRRGNYLVCLYVVVKLLYVINAVGQVFLLDYFITGSALNAYGIDVIRGAVDLTSDWPTASSTRFPRATMCDIKIRRLGNIHRYTVQCVLPINMFNEKIFLFLWFWFVFVAVVTCCSLAMWLVRFSSRRSRHRYIKQHLEFGDSLKTRDDRKITAKRFIDRYLNQDGVFILRMVAHNASTIDATELINALWKKYLKKPKRS